MTAMTRSFIAALALTWFGLASALPAAAQNVSATQDGSRGPLEINADEGIEWRRDSNQYIARGNARAAQADLEVFADVLIAHYRNDPTGGTEIYQVDAEGNVVVVSPSERVYGDLGRYDVDRGLVVLWGEGLRLETAEEVISARESLEYWEDQQVAVARGDAVAVHADKRLKADTLTAHFVPDAAGKMVIQRVDGLGNVQISTPTDFVRGDKGVYYVEKQLATLSGAVKITRGENQLNGAYAEVDLETGISRLLSGPPGSEGGRVRGLLVPRRKPDVNNNS